MQDRWTAVDQYFESHLLGRDLSLDWVLTSSAAHGLPAIAVSPCQGKLLRLLVEVRQARRVLEIGTLGGYSALWMAGGLPASSQLVTLERNEQYARVAQRHFATAGLESRIELRVGAAAESLAAMRVERVDPFDLVFIDADKPNNRVYVEAAIALTRPGSLIIVDNVVRDGAVLDAEGDASVQGVRAMTEWIAKDPGLDATAIQTVGNKGYDGFLLARVTEYG